MRIAILVLNIDDRLHRLTASASETLLGKGQGVNEIRSQSRLDNETQSSYRQFVDRDHIIAAWSWHVLSRWLVGCLPF